MIEFPPFRLDPLTERLWHGDRSVDLRPKTWALLRYLAERPGVVVPKEAVVAAVWHRPAVSDDALTRTLAEVRRALGDDARHPQFIQTVHGRGFRFVARLNTAPRYDGETPQTLVPVDRLDAGVFVGRRGELDTMDALFRKASSGTRQTVFVTGEPGAGKSAFIQRFLRSLVGHTGAPPLVGMGRCTEYFGTPEPYGPVLEALDRVTRTDAARIVPMLRSLAPTWLAQLPAHHTAGEAPVRPAGPPSPQRMIREFVAFIEAASSDHTVVLALKDLHWSDVGTVDLVSVLAQRTERTRLLIVGSCRHAEAAVRHHPIADAVGRLLAARRATRLALDGLSAADVADYVRRRVGGEVAPAVAALVHRRTEGNALFATSLVDHMVNSGRLIEVGHRWQLAAPESALERELPDDLRQAIDDQLQLASMDEREVLEAASVAGPEFDSQAVAAARGRPIEEVERCCDQLCRVHHLLRAVDAREWPDGSVGARYAFVHVAYQQSLYDRLPPSHRAALHQRIGERTEAGYALRPEAVATELASHFERGIRRARSGT